MPADFRLEVGGEGGELVDGAVVSHLNQGSEVLDVAAVGGEGVVVHADGGLEVSVVIEVILHADGVAAGIAVLNGVVDDGAVEPVVVPEFVLLILVLVVHLACEEVFVF